MQWADSARGAVRPMYHVREASLRKGGAMSSQTKTTPILPGNSV